MNTVPKKKPMAMARRVASGSRNGLAIRAHLVARGITLSEIARELHCDTSLVSHTIGGRKNNRRVLLRLLEIGVPRQLLALPTDMEIAA